MKVVTAELMRTLDARATAEGGIPGVVLMENAGAAVFTALTSRFGAPTGRRYHVVSGTGGNGGDGFVIARRLALAGASVTVELVGDAARITGDALVMWNLLGAVGVNVGGRPHDSAIRIDALVGAGLKGALRREQAAAIRRINAADMPVVSVDMPSGVAADSGQVASCAVEADLTVTFGYAKPGLLLQPGAGYAGEVVVDPIGFNWSSLASPSPFDWIRPAEVAELIGLRHIDAHKGDFGHVLIVGGSTGMSGAPTMTARAALRSGAGLVTVAAPASAQMMIAQRIDEAMTIALPERDGALAAEGADRVLAAALRSDAVCIGPGATAGSGVFEVVVRAVREIVRPMVVDADGLNALSRSPEAVDGRAEALVLTPHAGECARLLGCDTATILKDRVASVQRCATRFRAVVALKGASTLVCDGRGREPSLPVSINTTGNPGMATGGSGDVLTGVVGALLARGLDAFDACRAGVFIHGRAGDMAAEQTGHAGLIAGEIVVALPAAFRQLEDEI